MYWPGGALVRLGNDLAQLVEIAGPSVGVEPVERRLGKAADLPRPGRVPLLQEQLGQQRQIVAALGQRRQLDRDRAQQRGQLGMKVAPPRQVEQRLRRRRHQASLG